MLCFGAAVNEESSFAMCIKYQQSAHTQNNNEFIIDHVYFHVSFCEIRKTNFHQRVQAELECLNSARLNRKLEQTLNLIHDCNWDCGTGCWPLETKQKERTEDVDYWLMHCLWLWLILFHFYDLVIPIPMHACMYVANTRNKRWIDMNNGSEH